MNMYRKGLVIGIIVLFFGTSIVSSIGNDLSNTNIQKTINADDSINSLDSTNIQKTINADDSINSLDSGNWWNSNWHFRKQLDIEGASDDYQMMIKIWKEDGHDNPESIDIDCEDHCNNDFSDIRFVDSDQTTLLSYWTEQVGVFSGDHFAYFWVDTSGAGNIFMYYGNSETLSLSDGSETFVFFDDFEGDDYNHDVWNTEGSEHTWTVSDSTMTMQSTGDPGIEGAYLKLKPEASITVPYGHMWYSKLSSKRDPNSWATMPHIGSYSSEPSPDDDNMYMGYRQSGESGGGDHMRTYYGFNGVLGGDNNDISSESWTDDAWHYFIMRRDPNAPYASFQVLKEDKLQWGNKVEATLEYYDDFSPFDFYYYQRPYTSGGNTKVDWVFVAKYESTEPTWNRFVEEEMVEGLTSVSIQPSSQNVDKDDTFVVSVYVEPGEPIIGVNFDYLYFDQTMIHANSVTFEGFFDPLTTFPSSPVIDNVNGEIRDVYEAVIGPGNVSAEGVWVNIGFTAQEVLGTSYLDLSGVIVSNAIGKEAPVGVINGDVTIIDVPSVISISPSSQTVECDEIITISVYVEPDDPIIGVSFDYLYFDPELIQANSVEEGQLFDPYDTFFNPGTIDNINGTITDVYGLTVPASNTISDPGYFCNISFTAQQNGGTSDLILDGVIITNPVGVPVSVEINNGEVIVLDASPPQIADLTVITSEALDTDIGWEYFTCIVTDDVIIDFVQLNLTYPDAHTEYIIMSNVGDEYYYNTSLSDVGEYTYNVWAKDTNDNEANSSTEIFLLPPNEDVDMNGQIHFMDLVAVVMMYGDTGPDGWVREDVNNDGKAHFMDLVMISIHYSEEWN